MFHKTKSTYKRICNPQWGEEPVSLADELLKRGFNATRMAAGGCSGCTGNPKSIKTKGSHEGYLFLMNESPLWARIRMRFFVVFFSQVVAVGLELMGRFFFFFLEYLFVRKYSVNSFHLSRSIAMSGSLSKSNHVLDLCRLILVLLFRSFRLLLF